LWDEASKLYGPLNFELKSTTLECKAPSGMKIQFSHIEYDRNVYDWQGSQIPLIMFDELTHFTPKQFWYMLSRNRSTSKVPGYIRATCNADADSWVRALIDWWIDPTTGYPIPDRAGVLRYFIRINDELHWADSPDALTDQFGPKVLPKSLTFIPAKLEDNPILMTADPTYQANLDALPLVDRLRLKDGNWNVKATAGLVFKRAWFEIVDAVPGGMNQMRYWDRASTEPGPGNPDPDYTVGLKGGRAPDKIFYITARFRDRITTHKVETSIKNTSEQDGRSTSPCLEVDPGQAGVFEKNYYAKLLAGFPIKFNRPSVNKIERAKIPSAQAEAGNIKLLRGDWNEEFLKELEAFPNPNIHDDQVDTLSGLIQMLTESGIGEVTDDMTRSDTKPIAMEDESSYRAGSESEY
jgi:predicted phage terminase large subunit-like protein